MYKKTAFIASAASAQLEECILALASHETNIFFTAASANEASLLEQKIVKAGAPVFYAVTEGHNIAGIALAVIECAEKFGGIDVLLFGEWVTCNSELFLDINEDEFSLYTDMLEDFFCLSKCALPYMLGREGAVIILPTEEQEPINLARAMYRSACFAMIKNMDREFEDYGLRVKAGPIFGKELAEFLIKAV